MRRVAQDYGISRLEVRHRRDDRGVCTDHADGSGVPGDGTSAVRYQRRIVSGREFSIVSDVSVSVVWPTTAQYQCGVDDPSCLVPEVGENSCCFCFSVQVQGEPQLFAVVLQLAVLEKFIYFKFSGVSSY